MRSIVIMAVTILITLSCSRHAKHVSKSLILGAGALYESEAYEKQLGVLKFNNSKDQSLLAYPITLSYVFAFNDFLEENPAINSFFEKKLASSCFYLKIEIRDRGIQDSQIERWNVKFQSNDQYTPLEFVDLPKVSPRPSVKNRITQRGRETWWINETYVCSKTPLDWSKDFGLVVQSADSSYEMQWKLND